MSDNKELWMDNGINWSLIDYNQFEELALAFMEKRYPTYEWIPTKKVADGNKDMVSYETKKMLSKESTIERWAEVKYSAKTTTKLSRGQLDPTILSGLLSNSVKSIVFITNAHFTGSYLMRAEKLFIGNSSDKEMLFIDNESIESWLYENTDIYEKYFIETITNREKYFLPTIKKIYFIDKYNDINNIFSITKSLELYKEYMLYLIISSHKDNQSINIESKNLPFEIKKQYTNKLKIGLNKVKLLIIPHSIHKKEINFKIIVENNTLRFSTKKQAIIESQNINIIFGDQLSKKAIIEDNIKASEHDNIIINLFGEGGLGKTHLLQEIHSIYGIDGDTLSVKFINGDSNYSKLCKIVIYINYGNFYDEEMNDTFSNLALMPKNIINGLYNGLRNAESARLVIYNIINQNIDILNVLPNRNDLKLLLLDDIYKLDDSSWEFLQYILRSLNNLSLNIKVICATRRTEHSHEENNFLNGIALYSYHIKFPTSNDILSTIKNNIDKVDKKHLNVFADKKNPINVLFLVKLVKEIIKTNIDFDDELESSRILSGLYDETINNDKAYFKRLFMKVENSFLFHIVYLYEIGVKEEFIFSFFKDTNAITDELEKLKKANFITLTSDDLKIIPYHDIYIENYKLIYSNKNFNHIVEFFNFLLKVDNINEIYILNILTKIDIKNRSKYLKKILIYRDKLYLSKNYVATIVLSKTILNIYEDIDEKKDFNIIDSYYKCADSLNYCSSTLDSKNYFNLAIEHGKHSVNPQIKELIYSAQSEIISLEYWMLHVDKHTIQNIKTHSKNIELLINSTSNPSKHLISALLTSINRLMTYYLLLDDYDNAEKALNHLINESKKYQSIENKGYGYMDYAKGLYAYDIDKSYEYLNKAKIIFQNLETEKRRLLDCEMEILYVESFKDFKTIDKLIDQSNKILKYGYHSVYIKSLLKVATLNIVNKRYDEATKNIQLILKLKGSSESKRVDLLVANLCSAISHCKKEYSEKKQWIKKHKQSTNNLGNIYKKIANYNEKSTASGVNICFSSSSLSTFLIDPRMW